MKDIAIVTGASSGLGAEFAKQIIGRFEVQELWVIARRKEKLEELAKWIRKNSEVEVRVLRADLTVESDRQSIFDLLQAEKPWVRVLVNNAGYGDMGSFSERNKAKELGMIDLNIRALTEMTYECLPFMKEESRILQVASLAAFAPMSNFAVYAASKAFVLNFSLALNEELREKGISCTALCPGAVKTEFFSVATDGSEKQFSKAADAQRVVCVALKALQKHKAIVIPGFLWKVTGVILSLLPKTWVAHLAGKRVH